jgi:deoxycytidylate deaminase
MSTKEQVQYPYMPANREFKFVPVSDPLMQAARAATDELSGCCWWPTGAVLVRDGEVIARGANQGTWQPHCKRVDLKCPSGQGYEHCQETCMQFSHAEPSVIKDATDRDVDTEGADLYLFGHWWCCENCWKAMLAAGVRDVYLLENAHEIFTTANRKAAYTELQGKVSAGTDVSSTDSVWVIE